MTKIEKIRFLVILLILILVIVCLIIGYSFNKKNDISYSLNDVFTVISETEFIYVCSGEKLKENDVCEEDKMKKISDKNVIQDILSFIFDSDYYENTVGNNPMAADRYILYFMKDDNKIAELFYNKYMVLKKGSSSFFLTNENFEEMETLIK